jgi:hypothetical protein
LLPPFVLTSVIINEVHRRCSGGNEVLSREEITRSWEEYIVMVIPRLLLFILCNIAVMETESRNVNQMGHVPKYTKGWNRCET